MGHLCKDGTRRPGARSPASPRITVIPSSFTPFVRLVPAAAAQTTPVEEPSAREALTSLEQARLAADNAEAAAAKARALFERMDEAKDSRGVAVFLESRVHRHVSPTGFAATRLRGFQRGRAPALLAKRSARRGWGPSREPNEKEDPECPTTLTSLPRDSCCRP
jgi:hypothetical protein